MSQRPVRDDGRDDTALPSPADTTRRACAWCGEPFVPSGRRRYHSDACKVAAYRARVALARVPARQPRAGSVYECPGCETRYLGEQRCPDCNWFCRALGPGGECPCCGEPIAMGDLLG